MDPKALYRKAALEKFAAPERLDLPMYIVPSVEWVALWAITALIGVIGVWSIVGSIPETIEGQGMLIRGGRTYSILASGRGRIKTLDIGNDDVVHAGQIIGVIEQATSADDVETATRRYADAEAERTHRNQADREAIRGRYRDLEGYQDEIRRAQQDVTSRTATRDKREALLRQGAVTESSVQQARDAEVNAMATVEHYERQIRATQALIREAEEATRTRDRRVEAARQDVDRAERLQEQSTRIIAGVEGRVFEVKKNSGDQVEDREEVVLLEPVSGELEPVVFVSAASGKLIDRGMEVRIYPSTVKRGDGFIKGTVTSADDFPATSETIDNLLNNAQLVGALLAGEPKIRIQVKLQANPSSPSTYVWSSGDGPQLTLTGGTPVTVSVVIKRHRPISKLWPVLKSVL